jgi:hypothetical protein
VRSSRSENLFELNSPELVATEFCGVFGERAVVHELYCNVAPTIVQRLYSKDLVSTGVIEEERRKVDGPMAERCTCFGTHCSGHGNPEITAMAIGHGRQTT